jgi:hypothetical protein
MRITSELFVSQLVRRTFAAGGFAAIVNKGDAAAGAIFIVWRNRGGTADFFGPAVQTLLDADDVAAAGRVFQRLATDADEMVISGRLASERRFDSDLWVVEIDGVPDPAGFIELAPVA